jgi:hypothetical protein
MQKGARPLELEDWKVMLVVKLMMFRRKVGKF